MPGRVEGKVALITGAGCVGPGWGNGRAAAVLFAREGAKVFAVDKNAEAMTETVARVGNNGEIATHVCDVLDDAQVGAMVAACCEKFGRIDILVNNVGGSAAGGAAEMSEEIFDSQIDYNLKSVFLACRHVIPVMIEQWRRRDRQYRVDFRHALYRLAADRLCVVEGRRHPVLAGHRRAIRQARYPREHGDAGPDAYADGRSAACQAAHRRRRRRAAESRVARIPLGFMGDGRDTANAVLFLASDEARFITGTEIVVDGGMTARCD